MFADFAMFDTPDVISLRRILNAYPIPMFAAQRPSRHHAFRMLCVNTMHEEGCGVRSEDIEGLRPMEILRPSEGEAVEARYSFCTRSDSPITYHETLHFDDVTSQWRTTLFSIPMPGDVQRIVGTAIQIGPEMTQAATVGVLGALPYPPLPAQMLATAASSATFGRPQRRLVSSLHRRTANAPGALGPSVRETG